MANYDIRPLQLRLLTILEEFDKVCKEHNLRYYIIAGTLLGAVRHKGFIPWDDDIDVGMPRNDYELLMAKAKEWLPQTYEWVCGEYNSDYPNTFAKIQDTSTTMKQRKSDTSIGGIYVDVFPLDGVPEGKLAQKIHFSKYAFYRKAAYLTYRDPYKHGKGAGSWIPLLYRFFFSTQSAQKHARKVLMTYNFDTSSLVSDYDDKKLNQGITKKEIYGNPTPIIFEGKEFMGVEHTDAYLSLKYGDYRQIPSKENQHQHNFYLLMYNKSYKDYINFDLRPLQIRMMNILSTLDAICKEHNLHYYMLSENMLGAIRYQGFLPWSNHLEIGIPRPDYEKLIANNKSWLPKPYELVCPENDKAYPFPFAKLQDSSSTIIEKRGFTYIGGICINVYPLDGVPKGKIAQKINFAKYKFWERVLYLTCRDPYRHSKDISSWIPLLCRKKYTIASIQNSVRKILTKYNFEKNELIANYNDKSKGIISKQLLGKPTPILFEGKEIYGIENYHSYLQKLYGNYMEISKKQKRFIDNYEYLDLEQPYKE